MKKILFIIALFAILFAHSQENLSSEIKKIEEKAPVLPYYDFGKGVGITAPDSLFQLNIRFRMQNRLHIEEDSYEAEIRRLRLRFDGYVGTPNITYTIQLSFAPDDVGELKSGGNLNIIRDAVVFYKPTKSWTLGFGQTKLPGNRQRFNSSGALELTDRSINNAAYNIDRDFGFQMVYSKQKTNAFGYNIKGALTTGKGRNFSDSSEGIAYTGRLELYPLGRFKKNGEFFEADLQREEKPRLYLGGTFHHNHKAKFSQGQRGTELSETRNLNSTFIDAMLKYNGWAFMSSYMNRTTTNPLIDATTKNFVYAGQGIDNQLSYLFKNNWEIIGRFSHNSTHKDIREFAPRQNQFTLGLTKYIWEHAFKAQFEVSKNDYLSSDKTDNWYVRFQIEIGI